MMRRLREHQFQLLICEENMSRSLLPRLAPELESEFQANYFGRIRGSLRVTTLLLAVMFAVYSVRDYSDTQTLSLALGQNGLPAAFFLLLFGLTWARGFSRLWQPLILVGGLFVGAISFNTMTSFLALRHPFPAATATAFPADSLFFGQQMRLFMICMALLRLQFKWTLGLHLGLVGLGFWAFAAILRSTAPDANDISRFLQPTVAVVVAILLASYVEEQLARRAFLANHLLEEERDQEKRRREQTEGKLQVLSQAIGGIVHDLGNPLTSVQTGASTLDFFLDNNGDKATLKEVTAMINSGAEMLNYLRLSLIEQTRVLEGKPTPVDLKPTALCPIIEAGARFQNLIWWRAARFTSSVPTCKFRPTR